MIKNKEDLMALDQKFCDDTQSGGSKTWASYFSQIGVMVNGSGENIVGPEAIEQAMAGFLDSEKNSLLWTPTDGEISGDGSLGYTYGRYTRRITDDEGKMSESKGQYSTVWKKQENGQWKIVLDIGN